MEPGGEGKRETPPRTGNKGTYNDPGFAGPENERNRCREGVPDAKWQSSGTGDSTFFKPLSAIEVGLPETVHSRTGARSTLNQEDFAAPGGCLCGMRRVATDPRGILQNSCAIPYTLPICNGRKSMNYMAVGLVRDVLAMRQARLGLRIGRLRLARLLKKPYVRKRKTNSFSTARLCETCS